jgi:hypothetical protein
MSKAKLSATVTGMLSVPCRQCGRKRGQWCQVTGRLEDAPHLHMFRYRDWVAGLGVTEDDITHHVDTDA